MLVFNNKVLRCDDYYIKELANGLDELVFSLSIYDPDYKNIWEESQIVADGQPYIVKAIDGGKDRATVKCQLDVDEWKSSMKVNYTVTGGVAAIVNAIKPTGWTVVNSSGITGSKTLEEITATPMDILQKLRELWEPLGYRIDPAAKTITLGSVASGPNLGAYVMRQLNLRKIEYKGKSTAFATRLYATGKDGLTFGSINGGKDYVDDNRYSAKTICAYMQDDRIETAQELLAAARQQLAAVCVPQRSYNCDVADLAAVSGRESYPMFSRVTLIDDTKENAGIVHSVVERWRYPNAPQKNKVVLSTVAPRITSQLTSVINAINAPFSAWQEKQQAIQTVLTSILLGAHGGAVRLLDTDNDGEPDTLYIADDPDPARARKVWRFNYEGWGGSVNGFDGPFSVGAAFDGDGWGTLMADVLRVVNIDADNIVTGTIDASRISVINLDASNITSGTIDADTINVEHINASKINGGTLNTNLAGISGYISLPRDFAVIGGGQTVTGAQCTNFETTAVFSSAGNAFFAGGGNVFIGGQTLDAYIDSRIH